MAMKTNNLIACRECDALQRDTPVPDGGIAECARCGAELHRHEPDSLDLTLALVLAAAVVFVVANIHPLMGLDARGLRTSAMLLDTSTALYERGMASVAILVFVTVIAMPAAQIIGMLYLLLPLRLGFVPPRIHLAFRLVNAAQPWAMVDVFLLGSLVSLVKLTQVAKVDAQIGIYAVGGYVMLVAAAVSTFVPRALWHRVAELGEPLPAMQQEPSR
jgi:paraquat-inducible protein A